MVEAFLKQMGWTYQENDTQLVVWRCPFCGKDKGHFYINRNNGMWDCKKCGRVGNFEQLQSSMGVNPQVQSVLDAAMNATGTHSVESMPDCWAANARLMEDSDALGYLIADRGLDTKTIDKQKLGLLVDGTTKRILIPYFKNDNYVYFKSRSIPPAEREFHNAKGREIPLYNEDALDYAEDYIILVEGELDAITLMMHGFTNVVGVPGANMRKWAWIDRLIARDNRKIIICYDTDKTGQQAARDMAVKIGIDKAANLCLPAFDTIDGKKGKDINEWFRIKHSAEDFQKLLDGARLFEVQHTISLPQALEKLKEKFEKDGNKPALITPWPSLNEKLGGIEWGDLVGIIAGGKAGKTTLALNWIDYYNTLEVPHAVFLYCLEMPPERLARKWTSFVTLTNDRDLSVSALNKAHDVAIARQADFLFAYHYPRDASEVYDVIRQVVKRNNVKIVAFDNLQMLVRDHRSFAGEISLITKGFKQLALDLNIVILLIVQPNRVKDDTIVGSQHAWGSSAIEKDCDTIIALHRERVAAAKAEDFKGYVTTSETFEPQMRVNVDLSRYSSGGICNLWFDGSLSLVREYSEPERALAKNYEAVAEGV